MPSSDPESQKHMRQHPYMLTNVDYLLQSQHLRPHKQKQNRTKVHKKRRKGKHRRIERKRRFRKRQKSKRRKLLRKIALSPSLRVSLLYLKQLNLLKSRAIQNRKTKLQKRRNHKKKQNMKLINQRSYPGNTHENEIPLSDIDLRGTKTHVKSQIRLIERRLRRPQVTVIRPSRHIRQRHLKANTRIKKHARSRPRLRNNDKVFLNCFGHSTKTGTAENGISVATRFQQIQNFTDARRRRRRKRRRKVI